MKIRGKKISKYAEKQLKRAIEIAEEIDQDDMTNFDEYCKIINYLEEYGIADEIIEKWDNYIEWEIITK